MFRNRLHITLGFLQSHHHIAKYVVVPETDVRKGLLTMLLPRKFLGGVGENVPRSLEHMHWLLRV